MLDRIYKKMSSLEIIQKRIELLVGASLKMFNRAQKAMLIQDKIRYKVRDWNGTEEIRRWRERKTS